MCNRLRRVQRHHARIIKESAAASGIHADIPAMEPPHVLVIEDSASVRRLIEVCLRVLDVTISSAADGMEGINAIREREPDMVVLDIGLPGMDGWEVLNQLRSDTATEHLKVLVLTAHAQPEMADRAAKGGADAFMTKPFRPLDLREQVEKLLNM
ncbi:MAG: response regulator [Acidimicrobiia bacterium]|nr:response regulator [Acidimicrobiia bacterium]